MSPKATDFFGGFFTFCQVPHLQLVPAIVLRRLRRKKLNFFIEPPGMPVGQVNAHLSEEQVMRIGIPHRGGRLAFHAFNETFPVMVSSNAFWNPKSNSFQVPQASDLYELDFALDSAGYTAMKLWKEKGVQAGMAGVFPWSYTQYIELACSLNASWWSQPDLCCEPEIATSQKRLITGFQRQRPCWKER